MGETTNGGRAEAYAALRESEELHRAVLGNISDAVLITDNEGRFTFVCPNVDVIFGFVPDEIRAMGHIGRLLGENLFETPPSFDRELQNIEREVTAKSGERRTVLIHVKGVSIKGGTLLYACRDVTERRQAEDAARGARAELAHASRLSVVGELIGSIAHEITQPLAAASTNASAALRLLESRNLAAQVPLLTEILTDIRNQSHSASSVVDRLRSLVRKQAFQLEPLRVNDVATELDRLVGPEARRRGITLRTTLAPDDPAVTADRICLQQVVLNVIFNAMDAVGQQDQERVVHLTTRRATDRAEIVVNDSGVGVSTSDASRVFDPFFTTKKDGVGLGLTVARSLIEAQGGQITIAPSERRGATFVVSLPAR
jgi:PAS domain S-box-containing protein